MKIIRISLVVCLATAGLPVYAQTPAAANRDTVSSERTNRLSLNLTETDLRDSLRDVSNPPKSALAAIPAPRRHNRTAWGTLAGVAIGAAAGAVTAVAIITSDAQCQPHCGPRKAAAGAAVIGFPILGGLIGYAISKAP